MAKNWSLIHETLTPEGKTISLHKSAGSFVIRVDGAELMSTRDHTSEERLAELACEAVKGRPKARVLIGGLGFGFTLRAALASLPADATIVVAEMLPAVIDWNQNPEYPFAARALQDPRVIVRAQNVVEAIAASRGVYDAIALDVDNGPNAMTAEDNFQLYDPLGLARSRAALRHGGSLALWSAGLEQQFSQCMEAAGFTVRVERCRARGRSGQWHTIFVGRVN